MTKCDFKKVVIRACHRKNEEKLRALGRGKCERIQIEEYGKKSYLQKKNISCQRSISQQIQNATVGR